MENFSDQELIEKYINGDEKSFEFLLSRYLNIIYNFVYKYSRDKDEASDITQETFLKVWKNIKKINQKQNFRSWLFTIAKNTALDYLKKKKTIAFSQFEGIEGKNYFIDNIKDNSILPSEIVESKITKNLLKKATENLSSKYKEVLSLYYFKDLNFREISEVTKEPLNTIKSRHKRAIMHLKTNLSRLK